MNADNQPAADFTDPKQQHYVLVHGSREAIIEWLEWNDRDGCYNDDAIELEGLTPLSLDALRRIMWEQLLEISSS